MFHNSIYKNKYIVLLIVVLLFIVYRSRTLENFDSAIVNDITSSINRNKRKARMIKDGFTTKLKNKVENFARKHSL